LKLPADQDDGVLFADWKISNHQLVRRMRQPTEDRILNNNSELRKNVGAVRALDWAGWTLSIPELHRLRLGKKYPDLNSTDHETRQRAWLAFIASSEADPYRVKPRSKRRK
jgi:hypothetical protein